MWWIWLVIGSGAAGYGVVRWKRWYDGQKKLTTEEAFASIEHDVEMIKTAVLLEFLPILEDVMETLTDLLREIESRRGRQQ